MRASQVEPACHEESTSTVHQDVPHCDFPTLELTAAMFRRFCRCLPCRRGSLRGASLSLHRCQGSRSRVSSPTYAVGERQCLALTCWHGRTLPGRTFGGARSGSASAFAAVSALGS